MATSSTNTCAGSVDIRRDVRPYGHAHATTHHFANQAHEGTVTYTASLSLILAIKEALVKPARNRNWSNERRAAQFAAQGWVTLTQIEDALEDQDPRLFTLSQHFEAACVAFELGIRWTATRPRSHHTEYMMTAGVSTTDAAALMIRFHQLGFQIRPADFINAAEKDLRSQARLTQPEIDILFFEKTKDRSRLCLATKERVGVCETEKIKTESGHTLLFQRDGDRASLCVNGPKYRLRKAPTEVKCEQCGFSYAKGDLESSLLHRSEHHRWCRSFQPQPLKKFGDRLTKQEHADVVSRASPKWMHEEAYERALMFKREMGYDFPQWTSPPLRGRTSEVGVAYLLTLPEALSTIVGACAFRERDEGWTMDWVWIAPIYRRRGVLQRYWPRFVGTYGDFPLEYPLSDAMKNFVFKHGTPAQHAEAERRLQLFAR